MHIIPAAGRATRIGGIPKYLLPINSEAKPILKFHIEMALANQLPVCVVVNPKIKDFILELFEKWNFANVHLISAITSTMTETIQVALDALITSPQIISVSMPDTLSSDMLKLKYSSLKELRDLENSLALWKIRPEQRGKLGQVNLSSDKLRVEKMIDKDPASELIWSWGMFSLESQYLIGFHPKDAHPGISMSKLLQDGFDLKYVIQEGRYWDCGTTAEYSAVLSENLSAPEE